MTIASLLGWPPPLNKELHRVIGLPASLLELLHSVNTAPCNRVVGFKGMKPLLGEFSLPRFEPRKLWTLISLLTQSLARNHSEHAFAILSVKELPAGS